MKKIWIPGWLAAALITSVACQPGSEDPLSFTVPEFSEAEYEAHLAFLASDYLEGRSPGTRGGEIAANYIASQFQAIGLEPPDGRADYFQQVPLRRPEADPDSARFVVRAGRRSQSLVFRDDVLFGSELTDEEVSVAGELLFVGYGIEAPEYGWDDYGDAEVEGRLLVMLPGEPEAGDDSFRGPAPTMYMDLFIKCEMARTRGARGVLFIMPGADEERFEAMRDGFERDLCRIDEDLQSPLAINAVLSPAATERILALAGRTCQGLAEAAGSADFQPVELGLALAASLEQEVLRFTSPNVIGVLPGSSLSDEALVYMAHYDHLGIGRPVDGDPIYNGALDNASGTAALICLARAYAQSAQPRRSVVFLATTGEENRFLGSEYYARHPVRPLTKTAAVINMDIFNVFGPTLDFFILETDQTEAGETLRQLGESREMEMSPNPFPQAGLEFRTDGVSFLARGVVAFSVYFGLRFIGESEDWGRDTISDYVSTHYHKPSDEIGRDWRYDGAVQHMQLCYTIGRCWAEGASAPRLVENNGYQPAARFVRRE